MRQTFLRFFSRNGAFSPAHILLLLYLSAVTSSLQAQQFEQVPHPDLSKLESEVREELQKARGKLQAVLDNPISGNTEKGRAYSEIGILYQRYTFGESALYCYQNAERAGVENPCIPYLSAGLLLTDGKIEEACAAYERALKLNPDYVPAMIGFADLQSQRIEKKFELAEKQLLRAMQVDPSAVRAKVVYGKLLYDREELPGAKKWLEEALAESPQATEIHYPLGLVYRELGDLEKAESFLSRQGDARAPMNDPCTSQVNSNYVGWRVNNQRCGLFFQQNQFEAAYNECVLAAKKAPEDERNLPLANLAAVQVHLAQKSIAQNNMAAARKIFMDAKGNFEESIGLNPNNQSAHFNYATLLATQFGRDDLAILHYKISTQIFPDQRPAYFNLTLSQLRLGLVAEARESVLRVLKLYPADSNARLLLVRILIRMRQYDDALAYARESAMVLADEPEFRHLIARLLASAAGTTPAAPKEALQVTRETREKLKQEGKSTPHQIFEIEAMAYARMGQFERAEDLLRTVLRQMADLKKAPDLSPSRTELITREEKNLSKLLEQVIGKIGNFTPYPPDHPSIYPPPLRNFFPGEKVNFPLDEVPAANPQ